MISILPFLLIVGVIAEDYVHNPIQYHKQSDSGSYNWGYDTGLYGAHQFHQENKDDYGNVRGRYGYTDPDGKLRLTYYSSGPGGYKTWGPKENRNIAPSPPYVQGVSHKSEKYSASIPDGSLLKSPSRAIISKTHHHDHHHHEETKGGQQIIETKGQQIVETKGQQIVETKGQQIVETKGQQKKTYYTPIEYYKTKSVTQVRESNKPEPVTPVQYREIYQSNYKPASRYSRCYCV